MIAMVKKCLRLESPQRRARTQIKTSRFKEVDIASLATHSRSLRSSSAQKTHSPSLSMIKATRLAQLRSWQSHQLRLVTCMWPLNALLKNSFTAARRTFTSKDTHSVLPTLTKLLKSLDQLKSSQEWEQVTLDSQVKDIFVSGSSRVIWLLH